MFETRSLLATALARGGKDGADGGRALRLGEVRGWHLVQIGVFAGSEEAFAAAVSPVLGAPLPHQAEAPHTGRGRVYRIAHDQYWVVSTDGTLEAELARAVDPATGTVTLLSHSRVRLRVSGTPVRELLASVLSIDVHPGVFPIGAAAQTGMHHLPVLVERTAADSYDFYLLRTYAQTLWEWLADAALYYGYDVEGTQL